VNQLLGTACGSSKPNNFKRTADINCSREKIKNVIRISREFISVIIKNFFKKAKKALITGGYRGKSSGLAAKPYAEAGAV